MKVDPHSEAETLFQRSAGSWLAAIATKNRPRRLSDSEISDVVSGILATEGIVSPGSRAIVAWLIEAHRIRERSSTQGLERFLEENVRPRYVEFVKATLELAEAVDDNADILAWISKISEEIYPMSVDYDATRFLIRLEISRLALQLPERQRKSLSLLLEHLWSERPFTLSECAQESGTSFSTYYESLLAGLRKLGEQMPPHVREWIEERSIPVASSDLSNSVSRVIASMRERTSGE